VRAKIIAIGNSKGIRIPRVLLKESGIEKEVELKVIRGGLKITPVKSGLGWAGEPALLSESVLSRDWNRPEEDEAWANL
jgi:antitoxin MazE